MSGMTAVGGSCPVTAFSLSVVVPVYNSEASLPVLVERLEAMLVAQGTPFELILVNDCSQDRSWEVIGRLASTRTWIHGIALMRNYGQHNALLCGIRSARHDIIVTMDDDLQHPPEEIPKLLRGLTDGYDVVYGTPEDLPHGFLRNLASTITKIALQTVMGAQTARRVSAFRVFRARIRNAFETHQGSYVSIDVLLTWGTTRFTHRVVRHDPRHVGTSNYTFRKLLTHALNMVTGFSTLPLQLASVVGFGLTIFGVLILVYVIGRYMIQGGAPSGFPFLASIIAIFSGAQLFALGVIGEYLARIHFRLLDRPSFVVADVINARRDVPATRQGT